jgi:hypothetical protein
VFLWIYGSPNEVLPKKLIFYLYKCIFDVNRQYEKEVKNKLRFKISPLEKYFYEYKLILNIKYESCNFERFIKRTSTIESYMF